MDILKAKRILANNGIALNVPELKATKRQIKDKAIIRACQEVIRNLRRESSNEIIKRDTSLL